MNFLLLTVMSRLDNNVDTYISYIDLRMTAKTNIATHTNTGCTHSVWFWVFLAWMISGAAGLGRQGDEEEIRCLG